MCTAALFIGTDINYFSTVNAPSQFEVLLFNLLLHFNNYV